VSSRLSERECHLDYGETERVRVYADPDTKHEVIERLQSIFRATPLEIVSEVLLRYPHLDGSATTVLSGFTTVLSGYCPIAKQRKRLEDLRGEEADDDETYQLARSLTKSYGVF